MEKIKKKWATNAELTKKVNELIDEQNDLRKAYHAEMNAISGLIDSLINPEGKE